MTLVFLCLQILSSGATNWHPKFFCSHSCLFMPSFNSVSLSYVEQMDLSPLPSLPTLTPLNLSFIYSLLAPHCLYYSSPNMIFLPTSFPFFHLTATNPLRPTLQSFPLGGLPWWKSPHHTPWTELNVMPPCILHQNSHFYPTMLYYNFFFLFSPPWLHFEVLIPFM